MWATLRKHSGKATLAGGGGLSLIVALQIFTTQNEFKMLREDVRDLNREFREHEMRGGHVEVFPIGKTNHFINVGEVNVLTL